MEPTRFLWRHCFIQQQTLKGSADCPVLLSLCFLDIRFCWKFRSDSEKWLGTAGLSAICSFKNAFRLVNFINKIELDIARTSRHYIELNKTIESIIKPAYDICIYHEVGILRWIKNFVRDNIIGNESDYFDPRAIRLIQAETNFLNLIKSKFKVAQISLVLSVIIKGRRNWLNYTQLSLPSYHYDHMIQSLMRLPQ